MPSRDTDISKFMSLVLRHQPDVAGLTLDENGWAALDAMTDAAKKRFGANADDIRRIVRESPKQRFTIEGDRIRAAQGHSVAVDLALSPSRPPDRLFHGTSRQALEAILVEGLTKQARHHVHLSPDIETARIVARRRKGENVILSVHAKAMAADSHVFYRSDNGVWLTDAVPPRYLECIEEFAT